MKKYNYIIASLLGAMLLSSCSSFLDEPSYGYVPEEDLKTAENADKALIAAYSSIGNDEINRPLSLWNYGSVRADDAYKGGNDQNDGEYLHFMEISSPSMGNETWYTDNFWYNNYIAISRSNLALRSLNEVTDAAMPLRTSRIAEARFLRAHMHFIQKVIFKKIPYITENMSDEDITNTSNTEFTNDELWQKIADDFQFAFENLPDTQEQVGRPTNYAAAAYLAKVYLYKAYRQDDKNNVTEINAEDLQKVVDYTAYVMQSPFGLEGDFANNFLPGSYENGIESIFAVQYSMDDGTFYGRLNMGNALNTPTSGGDFNKPSQDLVNAFKTTNGLPAFDNYSYSNYNESTDKVDPRLFHTVALPGKPYKYTDKNYTTSQTRNAGLYGYYSSLKENIDPASPYYQKTGNWYANSKNTIVLRYADVVLMRAEALVELGRQAEALPLINLLRSRAKSSMSLIDFADTLVDIQLYQDGTNCTWTQDYARKAYRWERRMEMSMEGYRMFDLVRWGIADQVMNNYYANERSAHPQYSSSQFTKNKNEYVPVPIQQINFSKGKYTQNYGY